MENEQLVALLAELTAKLEKLEKAAAAQTVKTAASAVGPKAVTGRTYTLLADALPTWGKVPQQQRDLALICSEIMTKDEPVSEAELFAHLEERAKAFPSLANSVQPVTRLFAYYRGLKNDGRHAGFVARGWMVSK
jgi:uncharacterized Fe-S cluster-containing MiaB family protein